MFILRLFVLGLRVLDKIPSGPKRLIMGLGPKGLWPFLFNFVSNACPIAYPKDEICSGGRPYYYGWSFSSLWEARMAEGRWIG
jgi:hypothetical protein